MNNNNTKHGLYDPNWEHDSCGIGFIANLTREAEHDIVDRGLEILVNLKHRGATGGDEHTGDGGGIMLQLPHEFFQTVKRSVKTPLPAAGDYGVAMVFLPIDKTLRRSCEQIIDQTAAGMEFDHLGWRDVPVSDKTLGTIARKSQPFIRQLFLGNGKTQTTNLSFEQSLYLLRRRCETRIAELAGDTADVYFPSFSAATIVYKGMFTSTQIREYYEDLSNPLVKSKLAVVHQRYSTNTFPSWKLAQPFRYLAHNGEINTINGNIYKCRMREKNMSSQRFGDRLNDLFPIVQPDGSDSASFDNQYEFLVQNGRGLAHTMMMMIPEAWGTKFFMSEDRRYFYEYHSAIMEPWDGPAAMVASDGASICATLDRNGLRPSRYIVTRDGRIVLASEVGALEIPPENVLRKGRLAPGRMLLVDTEAGRIITDNEVKSKIVRQNPYRRWMDRNRIQLDQGEIDPRREYDGGRLRLQQRLYGYTDEELNVMLKPMAENGQEPIGSMGVDTPLAVLSHKPKLIYHYFKQLFAQVTNPPIDPYRESLVMSLMSWVGNRGNLLEETPEQCRQLKIAHPIFTDRDYTQIDKLSHTDFKVERVNAVFPTAATTAENAANCAAALEQICADAERLITEGASCIIISDEAADEQNAPIPSLLAVSAVHKHLISQGTRAKAGLIVAGGDIRDVMHVSLLIGFGVDIVYPYVAYDSLRAMAERGDLEEGITLTEALANYINSLKKGLFKTFSRMGISTVRSYRGAQIFEAVGLAHPFIDRYFRGTPTRLEGVGLDDIIADVIARHRRAYAPPATDSKHMEHGSHYRYRRGGEVHLWDPAIISHFFQAVREDDTDAYREYSRLINDRDDRLCTLRGMFTFKDAPAVPLDSVEPADDIVKRFASGAMSFGSISPEAHTTIARAMNRIGAMSNSGEGGELASRYHDPELNSAIKQVASGRFGVDIAYLNSAREIQIKMAQGAKPGEGGHLPGHKVDAVIAKVRNSTPGVQLISPPPHHDIYSIEDLAQLIFDLRNSNPDARVSVKLVSEVGVGAVAAGVAKAHADMVLISGHDGGTGASPLTSIQHAGLPWELGVAETQQTLIENGLRGKIRVQTDGQVKTGHDLAVGILLGAEEFGFATSVLVAMGCCLLRKCHLNRCTMGIATQDPEMRKRFQGKPEHIIRYLYFIAEELREIMASLGFSTVNEMVGRSDLLTVKPSISHPKAAKLNFDKVFYFDPDIPPADRKAAPDYRHTLPPVLDDRLIEAARPALESGQPVRYQDTIKNTDRSTGTKLSSALTRAGNGEDTPDDLIHCTFRGTAGQSFGAFLARGITLELFGDANDYVGKGLSGGRIVLRQAEGSTIRSNANVIAGNTLLYGAVNGEVYINGIVGERFAVRNSGAVAVVEGTGDHACEYMTGGTVVVLGKTGRNFAAGMSGGIAYVLDENSFFDTMCNLDMVDLYPVYQEEDIQRLRDLIGRHREATGSEHAGRILDRWEEYAGYFVKVEPLEYTQALAKIRAEETIDSDNMYATEEVFDEKQ